MTGAAVTMRSTGTGFACCPDHLMSAVDAMIGKVVKIRDVARDDLFFCQCETPAAWFIFEVEPVATPPVAPPVCRLCDEPALSGVTTCDRHTAPHHRPGVTA